MKNRSNTTKWSWLAALTVLILSGLMVAPVWAEDDGATKIDAAYEFSRANRLASAGAITRSIPHYEKVLKAAPERYPQAYYNLAEVYRFKETCEKSVLLYHAYANVADSDQDRADAARGVKECVSGKKTGKLSVEVSEPAADIYVEGYLLGEGVEDIELFEGEYHIEVSRTDHVTQTHTVTIEDGGQEKLEVTLEKKLFYGKASVEVNEEGATIKLEPIELDSPKAKEKTVTVTSPMEEPARLSTGKYLLEVTKPGFDRWIRHIRIQRDDETTVDVSLMKGLPDAIRGQ